MKKVFNLKTKEALEWQLSSLALQDLTGQFDQSGSNLDVPMKTGHAALYSSKCCVMSLHRVQLSQPGCHSVAVCLCAKLATSPKDSQVFKTRLAIGGNSALRHHDFLIYVSLFMDFGFVLFCFCFLRWKLI